jgi:hypothetical protein
LKVKLSPKERAVTIALFSSTAVQAIADFGQYRVAGVEGSIACRCAQAAKLFVQVGADLKADGQLSAVALTVFCNSAGSFLIGGDAKSFAVEAFGRASQMLEYIADEVEQVEGEEQKLKPEVDAQKTEGDVTVSDVATENLDLPKKTIELLLSLSTEEIDLTSAVKIRAQDKKQSIESLKDIGPSIRKKILEAIDKAIGPEVVA